MTHQHDEAGRRYLDLTRARAETVECPVCLEPPGMRCRLPDGTEFQHAPAHLERLKEAR